MEPAEVISISPTKRLVVYYDPGTECPLEWNDKQGVINLTSFDRDFDDNGNTVGEWSFQ